MHRTPHVPTPELRRRVESLAAVGVPQEQIAKFIGVAPHTLRKHYRDDLDRGAIKANTAVAKSLFRMATTGKNVAAAIFWLKIRCGWRERIDVDLDPKAKPGAPEPPMGRVLRLITTPPKRDGAT